MAAPQLRLEVSLNLTGFRGEIQKLTNIAQSEFAPKINVKFNRRTLDTELNNLQAAIKRRTYRVQIGGNIDLLPNKIKALKEQLSSLESFKVDLGIGAVKSLSSKDAKKIATDLRSQIVGEQKKIYVPVSIKPSIARQDVRDFKNAVQSKLTGLSVKVKADLEAASISSGAKSRSDIEADVRRGLEAISEIGAQRMAGSSGGVTEAARREQLRQSLATGGFGIGGLKDIGSQLGVAGVGRFKNANNLIEKIVTESSIEMVKKYLDPQAVMRNPDRSGLGKVLDTFARGIFNMLGMDPASIRAQQQASRPKPFTPAGLLPPAYRGIGPSAGPAGLLPPAYRGIGPSAKPAGLLPSLSSAGRSNAIIEALIASTGPRLLPSGGGDDSLGKLAAPRQTKEAVDAILRNYFKVVEAQVKEVFSTPPIKKESLNIFDYLDTEQYFNYLAQARINAENAIKRSIEEAKQVTKRNQIKDAAQSFLRALEEVVRNAERSAFTQSRIAANRSYVQRANIREIGQPLLGGMQVAPPKMLSAATGFYRGAATPPPLPETQTQLFARREREARMRSVLRGVDVMGETPTRAPARYSYANRPAMPRRPTSAIVPYEAGGALVPSGRGGGGAPPVPPRGGGGGGSFGGMQFNVPKLPGAGLVREIGTEFGFAAKQVLLFGTAYKALAFIQGFPAQVGEAVGALQSFRNTIKEISPSAEEAAESSQFILDVVDKYNTPIQSARDGFTKLYASMKPTGFSGDEIRDLFLGITQAAATFGMSAEKVDRVNYAFAQMASKGQVMSEELKGQLGDVLPGAMGIFAEAAGFKGPEAITKFSKALEDGAYKGAAMKTLLTNVGSIMRQEFGPGAEGAARTFQGVMNRMQNSTKLLYEAFEPVAVGFLNSVVMPLTSGLKTVTDGFNAFFTGVNATTAGGFAFAQELEKLRPTFEGLRTNAIGLAQVFGEFAKVALGVSSALLQIAGNPIVGFMAKIYAIIVPLNMALGVMRGLWALNSLQLLLFNARVAMGVPTLSAFRGMMQATGATAAVTATSIRTAGLTLRTFFASTGVGLILVGISLLIERFMSMNQTLADTRAKALSAADAIRAMSGTQARQAEQQATSDLIVLRKLQSKPNKGQTNVPITTEEKEALSRAGIEGGISVLGQRAIPGATLPRLAQNIGLGYGTNVADQSEIVGAIQRREAVEAEARHRQKVVKAEEVASRTTAAIAPITGVAGTGTGAGAKPKEKKERESQIPQLMLQLEKTKELSAVEMQIVNAQLINNTSQLNSLELLKRLIEFKYEAKSLALEDLTTEERALKYREIGLRREQAIFENQLQLQIDLKKERDEIQQGFAATLAGYQEEAGFQQMYLDLINQGVLPSLAKVRVEAVKAFAEGEKKLDQSIEQIQLNIAGLELAMEALKLEKNLTPEKKKQLEADEKRLEILKEDLRLRGLLKDTAPERRGAAIAAGEGTLAPKTASEYAGEGLEAAQDRLEELTNTGYQVVQAANAIGDAFGEAFKGVITGSMTAREALAGMFQSVADHFADMVAQMIAEYLKMALIKGIMSIIGGAAGALGGGLSSGFNAGTSSAIDTGATGWANSFATPLKFANGGITPGGFTAFANGGVVTGPTLGLVGEGRYNEAVIPLPDGKSVPVQLSGGDGGNQINSNITVNVSNGQAQSNATGSNSSELGRKLEGAVKQVIVGELRPGGLLASR